METRINKRAEKVEVAIEELKDSAPSDNGAAVVLETEATVDGSLHDTSIEVPQDDVPAVAVALLNTDAGVAPAEDHAPPAICVRLGAAGLFVVGGAGGPGGGARRPPRPPPPRPPGALGRRRRPAGPALAR